jgi:hypothetical protein
MANQKVSGQGSNSEKDDNPHLKDDKLLKQIPHLPKVVWKIKNYKPKRLKDSFVKK